MANLPEIPKGEIERILIAREAFEAMSRPIVDEYRDTIMRAAITGRPIRTYYCEQSQKIVIEAAPSLESS
jgi:hypothetical protein